MDKLWFYTKSGTAEKQGPVPENEIRGLISRGALTADDLLWTEGMSNWLPLSRVSELNPGRPPATGGNQVEIPPGLGGWMTFTGVMNIAGGILSCLTCVGILWGIPMIIAGSALMAARKVLDGVESIDASLETFFQKLKTFMMTMGIVYIISMVMTVIGLFINFAMLAAALAAAGATP